MKDPGSVTVPSTAAELERINRWPVGVLAAAGVDAGATAAASVTRAQQLLGEHGTSRRIGAADAERLLLAIRTWAVGASSLPQGPGQTGAGTAGEAAVTDESCAVPRPRSQSARHSGR